MVGGGGESWGSVDGIGETITNPLGARRLEVAANKLEREDLVDLDDWRMYQSSTLMPLLSRQGGSIYL